MHKKSWAVIDRPYSLRRATVGALYERPRCIFCAKPVRRGFAQKVENCHCSGGHRRCESIVMRCHSPPCITARRGGCVIKKISRSHRSRRSRGGFLFIHRKTTPASRSEDAARHFIDRSAIPPCGDARRGMAAPKHPDIFHQFELDHYPRLVRPTRQAAQILCCTPPHSVCLSPSREQYDFCSTEFNFITQPGG